MKVKVSIKPGNKIKTRLGIQKGGLAHAFFTSVCFKYMSPFVPGGVSSHLNQNVDIRVDKIIYESHSAHFLWNGKLYIDPETKSPFAKKGNTKIPTNINLNYHTPGTGPHWDKLMWSSKSKEVIKEVQTYKDRGCK